MEESSQSLSTSDPFHRQRASLPKALSTEQFHSEEELRVLRAIVCRESALDKLLELCCVFEPNNSENEHFVCILQSLMQVRQCSLAVIAAIAGWRRRMIAVRPFIWRQVNYVLRMSCDLDFVSKSQRLVAAMDGMRLPKRNPFSTIGGLDQSMRSLWQFDLPEDDDLPALLDGLMPNLEGTQLTAQRHPLSASTKRSNEGSEGMIDVPQMIRLAERFILLEEGRFGRLSKAAAAEMDYRMRILVQKEAEFSSKSRMGGVQ